MNKRSLASLFSLLLLAAVFFSATAVVGQEIPRGQIYRHARTESGPISNINPFNPAGPGLYPGAYELLAYADTLSGKIKPWLAESWGWVDDYTFEIKLRPEAHWSDGSPVTAEDVVFSLDSLTNPTYGGARRAEVESYSAADERTVWVLLNEEYPRNARVLGVLLTEVIPKVRWEPLLEEYGEEIVSYTDLDDLESIITSYPYRPMFVGPDRVICERVDDYWGNQIGWFHHPKYVEDYFYGSNELVVRAGYEGHGCDWSGVGFNEPQWYKDHKEFMGCWDIDAAPENMFLHEACCLVITPNYNYTEEEGVYIFRELWLRQALAYATDAATSLESGWSMCGNLYPPTFLNPDLAEYDLYVNEDVLTENFETEIRGGHLAIKYSEEKAIEILQEHCEGSVEEGWTYNGVKLGDPAWTIQAVNGWADVMIEAKVIAKGWSDIGIPTEPVYPEFGTWMSNYATGNYIWTQMWSWIRLAETANPISDTFYDNFVLEPASPNIWSGSPGHYPLFFDGNHPPLPDTADEVRDLTMSLYEMETGSDEYIATVKQLQSILVPQVPFILPHGKSSTQGFLTDRWVNWPTASDPYEHRWDAVEPMTDLLIRNVRPKCIETTSFSLSQGVVEVGETVTASVTLENTADYDQEYQVEICKGAAKVGPGPDPIVWKVVTVPAGDSVTVELSVTIDEVGSYILTVDDWRAGLYDPGDPIEKALSVTAPAVLETVTETVTETETETETTTTEVPVPTLDMTSVAGAGIVALVVGVVVGWLVGSKRS